MNITLCDNGMHLRMAPLTLARPVGNIRAGILTNEERWKKYCPDAVIGYETEEYLYGKFPKGKTGTVRINASVIPTAELVQTITVLKEGQQLTAGNTWIAGWEKTIETIEYQSELIVLQNRWDIFQKNDRILMQDFELLTQGRVSQQLSATNKIIGDESRLFIEEGAVIEGALINTKEGPVYIGKDAEVMEGSLIRGPFALCEHAVLKMGTKIYGATTIGPYCKVGGEISNVVFQAFSNKGHDGFLGNSVVGEWCNFGADSNTSNLKNNYSKISAYSYETEKIEATGVQFMGLMMGDHSKCGINTMFNTATVAGFSANIYGAGFPDKYIPSFSWGEPGAITEFKLDKAIEAASAMMERRGIVFSEGDRRIFEFLAELKK